MALKRKERKGRKGQQAQFVQQDSNLSAERLIRKNAKLVRDLYSSEVWEAIIKPLLDESIASVSGRYTNNRYHHGSLTRELSQSNGLFCAAYQKALMDFHNRLHDFVVAEEKLIEDKRSADMAERQPYYNPFLEEEDNF